MEVEGLGPLGWRERVGGFGGVWVGARGGLVFLAGRGPTCLQSSSFSKIIFTPVQSISLSLCTYAVYLTSALTRSGCVDVGGAEAGFSRDARSESHCVTCLALHMSKASPDSTEALHQTYFKCQSLSGNYFANHSHVRPMLIELLKGLLHLHVQLSLK